MHTQLTKSGGLLSMLFALHLDRSQLVGLASWVLLLGKVGTALTRDLRRAHSSPPVRRYGVSRYSSPSLFITRRAQRTYLPRDIGYYRTRRPINGAAIMSRRHNRPPPPASRPSKRTAVEESGEQEDVGCQLW